MTTDRSAIVAWIDAALHELRLADGNGQIGEHTGLLGMGIGLDSIEVLQLIAGAEERFDLTVDEEDLEPENFATVGSFASFIEARLVP
jgi:acyl carrier protein